MPLATVPPATPRAGTAQGAIPTILGESRLLPISQLAVLRSERVIQLRASVQPGFRNTRPMPRNRLQRSLRATFLGLIVNTLLATAKLAAGLLGHSNALVADAVESLADLFSSVIVWRGLVVAAAPADADHP